MLCCAGCATVEQPLRSHLDASSHSLQACAAWYAALDGEVERAGVRDGGSYRIPGFPYLRVDRFLSSFRDETMRDEARFAAWTGHLRQMDATARRYEIGNLPPDSLARVSAGDRAHVQARTAQCAAVLAQADTAVPPSRALLVARARVPDDYVTWKRVVGLYAVSSVPFFMGVRGWQEETLAAFREGRHVAPGRAAAVRYRAAGAAPGVERIERMFTQTARDALGIPQLTEAERAQLLRRYAPVFEIDTAADHDRFGALRWSDGPAPVVELAEPVAYGRVAFTRYRQETLVQLVYTIWFPERPADGVFDLLAGRLDGIVFRVTLDSRGRPLVYDTIHPCGCFHMFFPTGRVRALPAPEPHGEWAFAPAALPAGMPGERIAVSIASRTHYLYGVRVDEAESGVSYRLADDDSLRALPTDAGGTRSAFGPDGIVPGTERAERFLFWPMGIANAGAMRQWGRQATAFVGRRHFDDADLIEKRFEIVSGSEDRPSATAGPAPP